MCTLVAKKFPNIGWIGAKNRDRSAPTHTKLQKHYENGLEKVTLIDEATHWSEGMNSNGISIVSSSLTPIIKSSDTEHSSKNGLRIKDALSENTVEKVVKSLHRSKVTGCVMVFDKDELYLIEGEDGTHKQVIKRITDDKIARTNHGVWIPSAGYQSDKKNLTLHLRRIGSEARLLIANYISTISENPYDLMVLLAEQWDSNPQLTTLREPYKQIQSRTTEQILLLPYHKLLLVRNTDGRLDFTQHDANNAKSKVLVGIYDS